MKIEAVQKLMEKNRLQKQFHLEKMKETKLQTAQRTMGVKRVMIQEEKRLFDRRIRDEESEYYRKRRLRDEIDQNKRQFTHMKLES